MDHLAHALQRLLHAVAGHDGGKQLGYLVIALLEHVLVVEPDALLEGELCAGLGALGEVELRDELVHGEHLLLGAGVPSQQRQEVDDSLGEVSLLAVAA